MASKTLNYLAFQSFDFERTWWRLFLKHVVDTAFDIYSILYDEHYMTEEIDFFVISLPGLILELLFIYILYRHL